MNIEYLEPLDRSWDRARRMLFRPFRLEFWMTLGFAAFLSNLGQSGASWNWSRRFDRESAGEIAESFHDFLRMPWMLWIFGVGFVFLLIVGVVFTWISARGRFIFIDDVLHERAKIVEPWRRCRRLGNSLFVLETVVGFGLFALFLVLFGSTLLSVTRSIWADGTIPAIDWRSLALAGILGAPLFILAAVFKVMTHHFVVPVMWKHDLGVMAAWARFWSLATRNPFGFFVYLLLLLALYCGVGVAVIVLGCCTCCIGFLFLAIPYVGSVVLLPMFVTFRGVGPEFLSQFGPEWDARPPILPTPPAPPAPPAPPSDTAT